MAQLRKTEARLTQMQERQWQDRWGRDYIPAIFANPREAPGISNGTILTPAKLGGRSFHTLSRNETWAALLALHHPNSWEMWEQRILYPTSRTHFLFGHKMAAGISFPPFKGTVDVADRMGILNKHPKIRVRKGADPQAWPMVPFFYVGDLLLFLEDKDGAYLINWPVKDKYKDFRRRGPSPMGKLRPDVDDQSAIDRNQLEATYYADAGIRTQQVAGEAVDFQLRCNLHDLFLDHAFPIEISGEVRNEIMGIYREAIGTQVLAYRLAREVAKKFQISDREAVALLRQGIWQRELRIDLFRPFLMDKPLRSEQQDVFIKYGHWFER